MGKRQNREYTLEFKQQAAELANKIGTSNAARQLGVPLASIHTWKQNLKNNEPQSKKVKVNLEEENRRLEKENTELKKVNHILKMAAAFFSRDHLK
jgi:transposase